MFRRTIGWVATVFLIYTAGRQSAWHEEITDRVVNDPWRSLGLLALIVAVIVIFVHSSFKPHPASTVIGAVIGIAAVLWAGDLFEGIKWTALGWLILTVIGLVALWALTVLDSDRLHSRPRPVRAVRRNYHQRRAASAPPAI